MVQTVKNLPAMPDNWVQSLGWEDPLEEGMATYCSILPRESQWTEESGGLQSMRQSRTQLSDPAQPSTAQHSPSSDIYSATGQETVLTRMYEFMST